MYILCCNTTHITFNIIVVWCIAYNGISSLRNRRKDAKPPWQKCRSLETQSDEHPNLVYSSSSSRRGNHGDGHRGPCRLPWLRICAPQIFKRRTCCIENGGPGPLCPCFAISRPPFPFTAIFPPPPSSMDLPSFPLPTPAPTISTHTISWINPFLFNWVQ